MNCGERLSDDARFCHNCGAPVWRDGEARVEAMPADAGNYSNAGMTTKLVRMLENVVAAAAMFCFVAIIKKVRSALMEKHTVEVTNAKTEKAAVNL